MGEDGEVRPETELHEGEEVLECFSPSRTSVLLLDYLAGFFVLFLTFAGVGGFLFSGFDTVVSWAGSGLIIFLGLVIAAPIIARAEIKVRGNTYFITDQRLIHEFKFVKFNSKIINFDRVTHLKTTRSIVDRLFRTGKIHVKTAGTGGTELVIEKIKNTMERQQTISRHIDTSTGTATGGSVEKD